MRRGIVPTAVLSCVAAFLPGTARGDGAPAAELERKLANGLEVVILPSTRAKCVVVVTAFRAGARDESADQAGTAHLAARLARRAACGSRPVGGAEAALSELALAAGASDLVTGEVRHELTWFQAAAREDKLGALLDVERERWTALRPDDSVFEEERKAAINELAMTALRRETRALNALHALAYGDCGLGRNRLGTGYGLEKVTLASVQAWRAAHYRPDNAIVVVAGVKDAQAALEAVSQKLGSIPRPDVPLAAPGAVPPLAKGPLRTSIEGPAAARQLLLGFRGPDVGSEDEAAFLLAALHVKDRLVEKLRGIAKETTVNADCRTSAPALLAIAVTPRASASIADVDSAVKGALALCRGEPPRDLARLKQRVGHFLAGLTAPLDAQGKGEHAAPALSEYAVDRAIADAVLARRDELAKRVAALENESFVAAMKRLLAEDRACSVVTEPAK